MLRGPLQPADDAGLLGRLRRRFAESHPYPAGHALQDPPAITAPKLGHFRSVLAQGEGQQLNALEFGQYEATANRRTESRTPRPRLGEAPTRASVS